MIAWVNTDMTRRQFLTSAVAACALRPAFAAKPLFNGQDFSGWTKSGNGIWTIEDGTITGRFDQSKPGAGYLFTNEEFTDFTLDLDFWVSKGGNSGVFVRQPLRAFGTRGDERPAQRSTDGVEVQIDYNDPKNLTGAIYNRKNSTRLAGAEDRWNAYRIECRGPRVRVWVEGQLVNDYQPLPSPKGAIGLQIHGGKPHDHVVRFRNIRLS
jgi:hypothetical protein